MTIRKLKSPFWCADPSHSELLMICTMCKWRKRQLFSSCYLPTPPTKKPNDMLRSFFYCRTHQDVKLIDELRITDDLVGLYHFVRARHGRISRGEREKKNPSFCMVRVWFANIRIISVATRGRMFYI